MDNSSSDTPVDLKEQPPVSSSDSKISVTIEDGYWVFKKRQESAEEVIFYNTDYFKRIGFPDAEVSIGKVTTDRMMKGGYYKHPEELTYPFRQFVYLIQREEQTKVEDETSSEETSEPSEHKPGFFERLGNYGVQISKGVQYGMDSVSPYFKTNPENLTEEEKRKLQEEEKRKLQEEEKRKQALRSEEESEKEKEYEDTDNYWIVRIPIINDDGVVPRNEYEKAEEKVKSEMNESRVEKELGKSKVGRLYEVGSRIIRMCESVKEYEEIKIEANALKGSVMSKWHKFTS